MCICQNPPFEPAELNFENASNNYSCLPRRFTKELCAIAKSLFTKLLKYQSTDRICQLAVPKYYREKYEPPKIERYPRKIEIVREPRTYTRTEQLSLNQVRKLIAARDAYKGFIDRCRYERYNRYIRKSMFSLYSRLANAIPPEIKTKTPQWSEEDWNRHLKWLESRAKPKASFEPPKPERKSKPLSEFDRTDTLAKHKEYPSLLTRTLEVSAAAKGYKTTERINGLSQPKIRNVENPKHPGKVSGNALKYEISERVDNLALPKEKKIAISDIKEDPFVIPPNALKAKPTERMKQLALPRVPFIKPEQIDPFKVSPTALKAKTTKRIIELAAPKIYAL